MSFHGFVHGDLYDAERRIPLAVCRTYSKAILVTAVLDEAKCIAALVVLGIPLPAIKTLQRQNVFHYRRDQVPEMLLLAIEEYSEKRVREAFDRAGSSLFEALEKPGLIQ